MNSSVLLNQAVSNGGLRELDRYFAERMAGITKNPDDDFLVAAALLSQQVGEGHVCLDLTQWAGTALFHTEHWPGLDAPSLEDWLRALKQSAAVGTGEASTPMVLDGSQLYLGRYWVYQQALARALLVRAEAVMEHPQRSELFAALFKDEQADKGQAVAAAMAIARPLTVISGGPGTGKTHTVAAILALLCEHHQPRIALAAPTGKAAVRLTESIHNAKADLGVDNIPEQAATLHRLLGMRPGRVQPDFHADNPLHVDVLVVDEASMISLPLMAKLLAALPSHARLILLGDKDQLASVEAGSVFADLCAGGQTPVYSDPLKAYLKQTVGALPSNPIEHGVTGPVADSLVLLRKSYRFTEDSGIGALSRAINKGDAAESARLLEAGYTDLDWQNPAIKQLGKALSQRALQGFSEVFSAQDPQQALQTLNQFRILCALRVGPTGVEAVNLQVEQALRKQGVIVGSGFLYKGRPIMVTENAPGLNLFNGDVGIAWPDLHSGAMRIWFSDPEQGVRSILPGRLPRHETAFAMTVHKSQGSEFHTVLLLLPQVDNPVLSRELIYTGVTRAVNRCEVWAAPEVFITACERRIQRTSGLQKTLYG